MKFEELKEDCYTVDFSSEIAIKKAEKEGLTVVFPDEFTLQIDIDNKAAFSIFEKKILYLDKWYDFTYKINVSLSGKPHRHVYVKLTTPVTPLERIFLQLFLGSDSTREFLSFQRIKNKDAHPTLFAEKSL